MDGLRILVKHVVALRPSVHRLLQQSDRQLQLSWQFVRRSFHSACTDLVYGRQLYQRSRCKRSNQTRRNQGLRYLLGVGLALAAIATLSVTIGYQFYNQPQIMADTTAIETLYAPDYAQIVDDALTKEKRERAERAAAGVWVVNPQITRQVLQDLETLLSLGNSIRSAMGTFPFEASTVLSLPTQRYLQQSSEQEWLAILRTLNTSLHSKPIPPAALNAPELPASDAYRRAVAELQSHYYAESTEQFSVLLQTITEVRVNYRIARSMLQAPNNPVYDASLLGLTDADWAATQTGVVRVMERILAQGIHPGYGKEMQRSFIGLHLQQEVPLEAKPIASHLIVTVLRPNLERDEQKSQQLAREVASQVVPEMISVQRGDVIVRAGDPITDRDVAILKHFNLNKRRTDWGKLVGLVGLVSLAVFGFWVAGQRLHGGLRLRDYLLILLLSLSVPLLLVLNVSFTSMQAIGLLLGSFYGSGIGVLVMVLLTALLPIGNATSIIYLIPSAVGGILGSLIAGQLRAPFGESARTREELALMGGAVGLAQGIAYFLLTTKFSASWYIELRDASVSGLIGLAWSIFALGLSPYLERLFDLVTPIRLAELANPNRPLLRQLALETPGTFQHTLHVATLAEAAARSLGCNVELVRAGTLYHDIGKMHDPLGFIENQMGGANKHDTIGNPWVSVDIIKKHVSEGLVMARQYRLPRAIQAFIPEHQGTTLIAYFYHQAKQVATQDSSKVVLETDFRYDGPIPQSRETGIVMLADSCEAALRSLEEVTPQEALTVVNRILRAKWQDEQLTDSGLTRDDLAKIAEVFVQVWQQFHHRRIAYPGFAR